MGLASQPGHPGLSLPIPQWPGGSGQSHEPGAEAGLLNPSAPSPQCSRRRERGRELSAHKDPKGLFGELPWWSLDAGRWSELAVASTHGHEGRATRTFNPEGPWVYLLAPGTGAPLGGGCRYQEVEEGDRLVGWFNLQSSGAFPFSVVQNEWKRPERIALVTEL